jgi:hypothetical protein
MSRLLLRLSVSICLALMLQIEYASAGFLTYTLKSNSTLFQGTLNGQSIEGTFKVTADANSEDVEVLSDGSYFLQVTPVFEITTNSSVVRMSLTQDVTNPWGIASYNLGSGNGAAGFITKAWLLGGSGSQRAIVGGAGPSYGGGPSAFNNLSELGFWDCGLIVGTGFPIETDLGVLESGTFFSNTADARFEITGVPEPSSIGCLAVIALCGVAVRRHKS